MKKGIIFNIQKFCLHDGDGIRTCVFLKGCPLRCIWCHNPESLEKSPVLSFDKQKCSLCGKCIDVCSVRRIHNGTLNLDREKCIKCGNCTDVCLNDANEIIGKEISSAEVMAEVIKDKIFYDTSGGGLTVTGGEPSYQADFTLELLRLAKDSGISVATETCGIGSRDFYKEAADIGTTFLYDIKCIDSARHKALTGTEMLILLSDYRLFPIVTTATKILLCWLIFLIKTKTDTDTQRLCLIIPLVSASPKSLVQRHNMFTTAQVKMI